MKKTWRIIKGCIKDYRFNSLLIKYLLIGFLFILVPSFIVESFYSFKISNNAMEEIRNSNERELERSSAIVDTLLLSVRNMVYNLADPLQTELYYLSTKDMATLRQNNEKLQSANHLLDVTRKNFSFLDSVYVYFEKTDLVLNGEYVGSFVDANDTLWYDTYLEMTEKSHVMRARDKYDTYPRLISFLYLLKDTSSSKTGVVVMNVDVEKLGDFMGTGSYRRKDGESTLLIFDNESSSLLYSDEYRYYSKETEEISELKSLLWEEEEFSNIYEISGEQYIISGKLSDDESMRYWYLTSMENYGGKQAEVQGFLIKAFLLSAVLYMLVSVLMAVSVYKPIAELHDMIEQTSLISLNHKYKSGSETDDMKRIISMMQNKNVYLQSELDQRMLSLHNAQIRALQSQIDPHFIYNTLEIIGDTIVMIVDGENEATNMVCALAKLLRISLEQDSYIVPLKKELEHAKLYTQLVNYKQQGNIRFYWDIPEEMLEKPIVKITLQPIIENAIFHGLRPLRYKGEIHIMGEMQGSKIMIHVRDNGVGISEEEAETINDGLRHMDYQQVQHIGLQNVNQRIKLIFGDECGVRIVPGEKCGTDVQIEYYDAKER